MQRSERQSYNRCPHDKKKIIFCLESTRIVLLMPVFVRAHVVNNQPHSTTIFFFNSFNPSVAICQLTSIVKIDIFEVIRTQNVLTYDCYLCCLQQLKRFISPKKWN